MLTNSSGFKLKASKSTRDLDELKGKELAEGHHRLKIYEKSGEGDQDNNIPYYSNSTRNSTLSSKVYTSRERIDVKPKSRSRRDEYQMPHISSGDRRGAGLRSRVTGFARKVERENDTSSSLSRGKFQEPLIKGSHSDVSLPSFSSSSSTKYYNDFESGKLRLDHASYNIPEDCRISKILRRLSREDDADKFLTISQQLQESLSSPDNVRYVRRAFDDIAASLLNTLHRAPGADAKNTVARCLGRVGFVLIDNDFKRYSDWIFAQFEVERNDIRLMLLAALTETLQLDKPAPNIKESGALMAGLQAALEATDNPEAIMESVDVIVMVTESYPAAFTKHFRDTVDILVGWHIDGSRSAKVAYYASCSLQKLGAYWTSDLAFTITLLGQFLEDMEAYGEDYHADLAQQAEGTTTAEAPLIKIAALIKVFNAVLLSLGSHPYQSHFLIDCLTKVLHTGVKTLHTVADQELAVAVDECCALLLRRLGSRTAHDVHAALYQLVRLQMEEAQRYADKTQAAMLDLIVTIISEVSGNLSLEFVQSLLAFDSPLVVMRLSPSVAIQNRVLAIYHGLLNLKNITLLQEAYRHVLGSLEHAYRTLVPTCGSLTHSNPYPEPRSPTDRTLAENTVVFHLRALSVLANATNSIIGMWALNPSVLELLAVKMQPHSPSLCPAVRYALLFLLHSHCSKSNNFVSSSRLVSPERSGLLGTESPTSGHLAVVLSLLARLLIVEQEEETVVLALRWIRELMAHVEPFFTTLYPAPEMNQLISVVLAVGLANTSRRAVELVADNVERLLSLPRAVHVSWSQQHMAAAVAFSLRHLEATDATLRLRATGLVTRLPLDMVVVGMREEKDGVHALARGYVARSQGSPMQGQHLRRLLTYLLEGGASPDLRSMLTSCRSREASAFRRMAMTSQRALVLWALWEAAQLCVALKLRTPLGKPHETFTGIEAALKALARDTGATGGKPCDLQRVRYLLEFLDHLEKSLHNAAEGCASTTLPAPLAPVRTFFRTNASTCREWLARVRLAALAVAARAGHSAGAVRHGHCLLESLQASPGCEIELAVMHTCSALIKLGEAQAITGLYVWCREVCGRKLSWLKAAAQQAAGRYEMAAEEYLHWMERIVIADTETQVVGFVCDRVAECYRRTQDWPRLDAWKQREAALRNNENGSRHAMSAEQAQAMQAYEEGDMETACSLMRWPTEADLPDPTQSWDSARLMAQADLALRSVAIHVTSRAGDVQDVLERCDSVPRCVLQMGVQHSPSDLVQDAVVLRFAAANLKQATTSGPVDPTFGLTSESPLGGALLAQLLWWRHSLGGRHDGKAKLHLAAVRAARKEGNVGMAQWLLVKYLADDISKDGIGNAKASGIWSLTEAADRVMSCAVATWSLSHVRAYTELAKLLHETYETDRALDVVTFTAAGVVRQIGAASNEPTLNEAGARLLVTLAKWLSDRGEADTHRPKLLTELVGQEQADDIGRVLKLSTTHCPSLGKAWARYAAWSYRWGKRSVGGQVTDNDRSVIASLLPSDASVERVMEVLARPRLLARDEEDIEGDEANTGESVRMELAALNEVAPAMLEPLLGVWREAQTRSYSHYQQAAAAYFKYLAFTQHAGCESCDAVTATLRLLRMIVKHAMELRSVLEEGLAATPTAPWMTIIPQLFSRLSHPEAYVRRRVSELLCRVACDAPHLITFPAVVGARLTAQQQPAPCSSRLFTAGLETEEEDEDDEDDDDGETSDEDVSVLVNCFLAMVDTLSKQASLAISQVELVVTELHRITLLWDELWLGTLAQHHAEVARRLGQLEAEIRRVDDNASLTSAEKDALVAEKHRIIMKPLLFIFEQLQAMTSVPPETPHEVWFQEKFSAYIADALDKLRSPTNPRRPHDAWQPMRALHARLQLRAAKRGAHTLRMADVSPALASLTDTEIAMPGVGPRRPGDIVTIAAVGATLAVLPTKTKPKKLVFHGSDGQMYTYLFKGLEDLHLDERIMQFLGIANTMLAREQGFTYRARHYSVTPLGPRSGLIGWVGDVTPLFGLYKRWQQRDAQAAKGASTGGHVASARPSELFYNKLTPLLKEKNVGNLDSRKEWPLPVLRQVLTELMAETPKDLLAKELWCHSTSASGWWRATRTYSRSVAVMSIIGYIIGLGDRHLDNVLVDLNTGEVVHIDYNVCFEKGKTLRVPEKVPFRMTQNIRAALGVTGVEGIFRLSCEHVLRVMKQGRETLLTLLEAFVYDPLIDWTPGNEAGYTGAVYCGAQGRKQLEREVTRAMFVVRLTEMRAAWADNRDRLLADGADMQLALDRWLEVWAQLTKAEEAVQDCHQQMGAVKEAEARGGAHALYTLGVRWQQHRLARDTQDKVRTALADRLHEAQTQAAQHEVAQATVRGAQLASWMQMVDYAPDTDKHMVFDLVKEFLHNAGQAPMVTQCEQSETELGQLGQSQLTQLRSSLDLLTQYKAVSSLYPGSYLATHRTTLYQRWITRLLEYCRRESIAEVRAEFAALLSADHSQALTSQQVLKCSYQQQTVLTEANMRLQKWYERLSSEEGTQRADMVYMEARAAMAAFPHGEKGAAQALECVNVTALCALNNRYILMERAAFCAGDSLVELTSRDGEWFLDEMYAVSTSMSELAGLVPSSTTDARVVLALQCVQTAHTIYKGLQELNFNFHTIILAEAVERTQAEEPSVMAMVASLDEVISSAGSPLAELHDSLEKHLRCIIMEMESPHTPAVLTVSALRGRFSRLAQGGAGADSPGLMLLMGFNGLFERLHEDNCALVAALDALHTPPCWRKVDQVRDARAISAPVFNEATRGVLEDIFLVKRLATMQEFFTLCRQPSVDDDDLAKPIRRYTADYVRRRLLGVASQTLAIALCLLLQRVGLNVTVEVEQRDVGVESKVSLEELCRKAVDACLKRGVFGGAVLARASAVTSALEASWRRKEGARRLQQEVEARRATLKRLHYQLTAYHWLHEDVLAAHGAVINPMVLINRGSFMVELRSQCSALVALQPRITEAQAKQSALVVIVGQRLKWAAGANPALMEVLAAFEATLAERDERLACEQRLALEVAHTCSVLVRHEALRTRTAEAVANDNAFLQLLEECEASVALNGTTEGVSAMEESLVRLLEPDTQVDQAWIHGVEQTISGLVKALQVQIAALVEALTAAQDNIKSRAAELRALLNEHHKLMADVKGLVKHMVKYEDADLSSLPAFWSRYRLFSEQLCTVVLDLTCEDAELEPGVVRRNQRQLQRVIDDVPAIYRDLMAYDGGARRRPPLVRQDSVCGSPKRAASQAKVQSRDPHTGKAVQERNAYAVNVWRRVRTKLEGRDPDLGRRLSNQEQVEYVIREATSHDNLSLLYEGWTPWV